PVGQDVCKNSGQTENPTAKLVTCGVRGGSRSPRRPRDRTQVCKGPRQSEAERAARCRMRRGARKDSKSGPDMTRCRANKAARNRAVAEAKCTGHIQGEGSGRSARLRATGRRRGGNRRSAVW